MIYLYSFLFSGFVCLLAQIVLDNTKLTPGHVTSIFVILGSLLDICNIYDKLIVYFGGGALVPITSFGHLLIHGALEQSHDIGAMGLVIGMFDLTSSGITSALIIAFLMSLMFKAKD